MWRKLSECTSIFKGGRCKELQQEIDSLDISIRNRLKQKEQKVKEREAGRQHPARQKDKMVR